MPSSVDVSAPAIAALAAYGLATFGALVLFRRTHNWRVRCLSVLVAALPVCEAVRLLRDLGIWFTLGSSTLNEFAELAVAALFLISVLVLKRECAGTANAEERLCLAEAAAGWSTVAPRRRQSPTTGGGPVSKRVRPELGGLSALSFGSSHHGGPQSPSLGALAMAETDPVVGARPDLELEERRKEARYPSDSRIWVVIHDPDPVGELLAEVLDVSRSGLRLSVPLRLVEGTELEADFGEIKFRGKIRWCRENADGQESSQRFQVGVRLDEHTAD